MNAYYIYIYECMVITVAYSVLLIVSCLFGKLSIGKLRKSMYRFSVHPNG